MGYVIGTDEAGYGPNLGPLVVSATMWRVPDELLARDLYELLQQSVVCGPAAHGDARLPIADSKQLYKPGGGLAALEHAVLAALEICARREQRIPAGTAPTVADVHNSCGSEPCCCWREIWSTLDPRLEDDFLETTWYAACTADLPCNASRVAIENHVGRLSADLRQAGAELLAVRSRVVSAARFNELLGRHGNKATVLSRTTLDLVADLLGTVDQGRVLISCDKHGGRNRYVPLLQQTFPEYLIEVYGEGRAQSAYRFGPPERRVEIRFTAGGEAALPAALASMVSKYLRELAMQAFNDFWLQQVPGLTPTAGYPSDAGRFHKSIAARQTELGIDDQMLWRQR